MLRKKRVPFSSKIRTLPVKHKTQNIQSIVIFCHALPLTERVREANVVNHGGHSGEARSIRMTTAVPYHPTKITDGYHTIILHSITAIPEYEHSRSKNCDWTTTRQEADRNRRRWRSRARTRPRTPPGTRRRARARAPRPIAPRARSPRRRRPRRPAGPRRRHPRPSAVRARHRPRQRPGTPRRTNPLRGQFPVGPRPWRPRLERPRSGLLLNPRRGVLDTELPRLRQKCVVSVLVHPRPQRPRVDSISAERRPTKQKRKHPFPRLRRSCFGPGFRWGLGLA